MTLSLTAAMLSAIGRDFTEPGLFVELVFDAPVNTLRLHDRQGSKSWNSQTWSAADVRVTQFERGIGIAQSLTLEFGDGDLSLGSVFRSQPAGKAVRVWLFDNSALAAADPVLLFEGVLGSASGGSSRRITVPCVVPLRWLPVGMMHQLMPAYMFAESGKEVPWGNGKVVFQPRGSYE